MNKLANEILDEVEGWSRDPLDTDHLFADWRRRAQEEPGLTLDSGCRWRIIGAKSQKLMFGVEVTQALHACDVHGDVRTEQLNGTWTLDEIRGC